MRTRKTSASVVLLAATAVVTLTVGPAAADPPFTPDSSDLVGVGSDTTQDVLTALATGYNARKPAPADRLASWNATGSKTIVPAKGCQAIPRPDGSGAGIAALKADRSGCLEFARSSRAATPADTGLRFVPFAADAVSWVKAGTSNAPVSLSRAELRDVYTCAKRRWNQVGGTSSATIIPVLPNQKSGTRAFFLTAISATTTPVTPGRCVVNGVRPGGNVLVQENDARELTRALPTGGRAANALLPYSVAKYVFQGKPRTISPLRGNSGIGNIDAIARTDNPDPVSGRRTSTSNTEALNTTFTARFRRQVFNVLKLQGSAVPAKFAPVFGRGGYICSGAGDAIVRGQGFGVLPQGSCGY
jgi:hypothetical protein